MNMQAAPTFAQLRRHNGPRRLPLEVHGPNMGVVAGGRVFRPSRQPAPPMASRVGDLRFQLFRRSAYHHYLDVRPALRGARSLDPHHDRRRLRMVRRTWHPETQKRHNDSSSIGRTIARTPGSADAFEHIPLDRRAAPLLQHGDHQVPRGIRALDGSREHRGSS